MAGATEFLRRFPPFDALPEGELDRAEAGIFERSYAEGELVLVEDGAPATHLYVVRTGSVELVHDGTLVAAVEAVTGPLP